MTGRIRILDEQAANQIAAGEVVERPVSVVKELVENALDAGANQVEITVEGDGVPFLRVRDNGCGMGAEDLPVAVLRHATSKIQRIEDLSELMTLGFRGEALPSIAAVSKLEIISRPNWETCGRLLELHGGFQIDLRETGCPAGTTVTVQDLFYNTPARRKFLRSANTEFGLIADTVGRLALSRPDVSFTLKHSRQTVLQTSGTGHLLEAVGAVFGLTLARRLIPVRGEHSQWSVTGYVSPPDLVRSTRQNQVFILNGRIIRSQVLSRAVQDGYHTLIPAKLFPVTVLHLRVPPSEYDVNVHPTKMEVRFRREGALAEFITHEIAGALRERMAIPHLKLTDGSRLSQHSAHDVREKPVGLRPSWPLPVRESKVLDKHFAGHESGLAECSPAASAVARQQTPDGDACTTTVMFAPTSADRGSDEQMHVEKGTAQTEPTEMTPFAILSDMTATVISDGTSNVCPEPNQGGLFSVNAASEAKLAPPELRPLAQIFQTYILATDGSNLVVVDQHAAHERVNYERLWHLAKQTENATQAILMPIPLELTLQEEQVVLEHLWELSEIGFVLEQFGPRTYLLRGVPAYTGPFAPEELLREFLAKILSGQSPPGLPALMEEWIYLLACRESLKARESLSMQDMELLLARLLQTTNPYSCPHGRPTMIKVTREELESRFYRT